MYSSHREAFQQKPNAKKPIESNLDDIINKAQSKMKEMILEKQNYIRDTNLLIGQEKVLNENINFLKSDINEKNDEINKKTEELAEIEASIKNLKNEQKLEIKRANIKEAKLKDDINNINEELESIKYGTIPAQASKNFELKKNCEEVDKLKEINNQLREKLYLLSRQLYTLEVRKYFFIILFYYQTENERTKRDEQISANKAEIGIENINEIFKQAQGMNEDDEINEEEEDDNNVRSDKNENSGGENGEKEENNKSNNGNEE